MPIDRWMASAAGGTSQRLKPGGAMMRSWPSHPEFARMVRDYGPGTANMPAPEEQVSMIAGLVGGIRNGSASLADGGRLVGVCAQERVTRVRSNRAAEPGMPDLALDALLERQAESRDQIDRYVIAQADG